jgi:heme/copper-type cytochrome/quinol oxidase subunit 2
MIEIFIILIWFLISFAIAFVAVNTTNEQTQKNALTIVICIFPLLLLPFLFAITPKMNKQ